MFTWGPQHQMVWNAGVTFTPWDPYTVADCPRYGELAGPSCATAPAVADPGFLPDALKPRALDAAKGLPPVLPLAGLPGILAAPPAPEAAPQQPNPLAGTPLAGLLAGLTGQPQPAPAPPPDQPGPTAPAAHAGPIAYTGDAALTRLLGRRPTAVEYLLLRASLEGGYLQVTEDGSGR